MDQTSAASARLQQSRMTPIVQPFLPCGLINPLLLPICLSDIDQYLFFNFNYFLKSFKGFFFVFFFKVTESLFLLLLDAVCF